MRSGSRGFPLSRSTMSARGASSSTRRGRRGGRRGPRRREDGGGGVEFLYASGTTGRPKAIASTLALAPIGTPPGIVPLFEQLYGFGDDTVYLSPAPLYHSAPLRFNMCVHRLGGTCVVMDRFDPAWALELVERHGVTHTQMVPTMFVRL